MQDTNCCVLGTCLFLIWFCFILYRRNNIPFQTNTNLNVYGAFLVMRWALIYKKVVFFKKKRIFGWHQSPFVGPVIPQFRTSGDICPGFESQGRSPHLHATEFLNSPAYLLGASMAAKPFQSTCVTQGFAGLKFGIYCAAASQHEIRQTLYQLSYANFALCNILRASSNRNGQKNRKIGIRAPKK